MVETNKKYDCLFTNIKPNAIGNIVIFSKNDSWEITQKYENITNEESLIWQHLYSKIIDLSNQFGSIEFIQGVEKLKLCTHEFPNIKSISKRIKSITDWEVVTVAGFLDEYLFFELNANRRFPSTDIIRQSERFNKKYCKTPIKNEFGYTPEPDIFHDVFGHMPFLTNQPYCDFMAEIGQLGYEILINERGFSQELIAHNLKRLQNFAWWTYEFGVMKNQNDNPENNLKYQIYGSGILSSYDEIMNVVNCSENKSNRSVFLPFDIEEVVKTRFDYSEIQDRYFIINSMEDLYHSFRNNKNLFMYEGK
jgi:phenylalanine-4-hydroxylase